MEVASLVVSPLVQVVYEKLVSYLNTLEIPADRKKNIKTLQDKLLIIQAVMEDAEQRQLKDKKVKIWLSKLRDVAYDADNLLDEITTRVLQKPLLKKKAPMVVSVSLGAQPPPPARHRQPLLTRIKLSIQEETTRQVGFASFALQSILTSFQMPRKLTRILERLDDIAREMSTFQFRQVVAYKRSDTREKRETGPYVDQSQVYGRREDLRKIVHMLLSSDPSIWVIPIIGIGGIGKTTLAQLVYNDQSLDGHFDIKIWVSLYDNFSSKRLVCEILECVTKHRNESSQLGVLQLQLQGSLCGKKYLLVLDDVWNDDRDEWDKVRNLLRCGAEGSRIIVTTRSEKVASVMTSSPPYHLEALTEDDCWTLFKQQAFASGEEDSFSTLLPIGRRIIGKCKGMPLAAKLLGGSLRFKREEHEWLRVQESDIWNLDAGENRILSVLRLSFNHLPSHLKQCFAYCAIFPRNYHLNKEKLIQQWIAGGLVQLSAGDTPEMLEHVGNDYFNDLLKMSFFQLASNSSSCSTMVEFKLPDLIYELAKGVAGNEFLEMGNRSEQRSLANSYQTQGVVSDVAETRHASVDSDYRSNFLPQAMYKAHKLSTLNLLSSADVSTKALKKIVACFRHLKILNLSGSGIKKVHRSIGKLIYLRYLDLSNTCLQTLPATIGHLCNLLTLELSGCADLVELPEEIINLIGLRHLNIRGCVRLACLPAGIGDLVNLQTLPIFIVGDKSHLHELCRLKHIQGELKIKDLRNVDIESYLSHMQIHTLHLLWGNDDEGKLNRYTSRGATQRQQDACLVLSCLEPHSIIRRLSINGYPGQHFPEWLNCVTVQNLTELDLINCRNCETLPKLGRFPHLKSLKIQGMDNVVRMDSELGEGMKLFPSLHDLTLRDFPQLRTWEDMGSTEAFPCLERLAITKCPLLNTMPRFPSLQHLEVQNCDPLILRSVAEQKTLLTLSIDSFTELPFIPKPLSENCSLLRSLTVVSCPNLPSLPSNLGKLTALKSLKIGWCEMLDNLPRQLANLSSLETLEIIECPRLITLPDGIFERLSLLRSLSIENCNALTSLPTGLRQATTLERLTVMYCPNLASLPDSVQNLSALKGLTILSCPELASLPEGLEDIQTLQNLEIRICPRLMALPKLGNLVSLRSLAISECENIKSLPEGIQQLSAIQHLSIRACPNLEKRYERGVGEDWQKIAHIPHVYLGTSVLQTRQNTAVGSSSS
ncbi:Disease resistance protein [Corchorus capsularis]|uniref:Disease resistance protein n=1 Tax=Corchorus capsularis TaxID=210143 RepID=A0A1R3FYD8_COCAP|nr:Disease resistance protein [Corchorus capsularis]